MNGSGPRTKPHPFTTYVPAKCSGVEFLPRSSLQLMLSGETSFLMRSTSPFLAASRRAASPRRRSAMSLSCSAFTMSSGVRLSRLRRFTSAPCWKNRACEDHMLHVHVLAHTVDREIFVVSKVSWYPTTTKIKNTNIFQH